MVSIETRQIYMGKPVIMVKKVRYSAKAQGYLNRFVSFPSVQSWDCTWLIGYRYLLRFVKVEYGLTRNGFEFLCYFGSGKDGMMPTEVIRACFGYGRVVYSPFVATLLERGYIEKYGNRGEKYKITANGLSLLKQCEKFWRVEIAR